MFRPTLLLVTLASAGCETLSSELKDGLDTGRVGIDDSDGGGGTVDDPGDDAGATNLGPVADAGTDFEQPAALVVNLDGSASYDPDGDVITFQWQFVDTPAGSLATLLNDSYSDPSFYADVEGSYTVSLTVSDGEFEDTDEVTVDITTANSAPTADAGPDQWVTTGDLVMLNGGGSSDIDGDALNYEWEMTVRPAGSGAFLIDETTAFPRFTADTDGVYTIELRVDDGVDSSLPDSVRVTAEESGGSSGGCLSCAGVQTELQRRAGLGSVPGAPAFALFPIVFAFLRRRS